VVTYRDGADPSHDRNSPGKSKYEAVSMERGITDDPEFENWANKVHPYGGGAGMDLVEYKFVQGYAKENHLMVSELIRGWIHEIMKREGFVIKEPSLPESLNTKEGGKEIMGVYVKGNRWYIDYYVNGKRKREVVSIPEKDPSTITLRYYDCL